jgi:hypothetical protein
MIEALKFITIKNNDLKQISNFKKYRINAGILL